nr:hypothetical protein [uncultured Rhodopila sp.]
MTDERTILIAQIEKYIAEGMTLKIIPSIPGVLEFVVSGGAGKGLAKVDPDSAAGTGLKTLRSVNLRTAELEPFERTAALLAYLLVPDVEGHDKRIRIYEAICYSAVRNGLVPWPRQRRAYLFQDETPVNSAMNSACRLARHRKAAALMALPFILASPFKGMFAVPKKHEMAEIVTELAMGQYHKDATTETKNVQSRVWSPSLPVIHLAVPVWGMTLDDQHEFMETLLGGTDDDVPRLLALARIHDFELLSLLARDDAADRLLAQAEVCEGYVREAPALTDAWTRLIRFSQS